MKLSLSYFELDIEHLCALEVSNGRNIPLDSFHRWPAFSSALRNGEPVMIQVGDQSTICSVDKKVIVEYLRDFKNALNRY